MNRINVPEVKKCVILNIILKFPDILPYQEKIRFHTTKPITASKIKYLYLQIWGTEH